MAVEALLLLLEIPFRVFARVLFASLISLELLKEVSLMLSVPVLLVLAMEILPDFGALIWFGTAAGPAFGAFLNAVFLNLLLCSSYLMLPWFL